MSLTDNPAWPAYKAALSRLAKAGANLEEADAAALEGVAQNDFQQARDDYESARARLVGPGCGAEASEGPHLGGAREVDGYGAHPRALWLGQSQIGLRRSTPETPEE